MWWWALVIPATWEAEAGELLETRKQRLQLAKIMPLPSSLGARARLCLKTNKQDEDARLRKEKNDFYKEKSRTEH